MRKQQIALLFIIAFATIAVFVTALSVKKYYESKVEEWSGIRQLTTLKKEILELETRQNDVSADIKQLQEQLDIRNSERQTIEANKLAKIDKKKEISTAIYYLNQSLWITTPTITTTGELLSE